MNIIKPKKLKRGDTIGIMAPSGWGDATKSAEAISILEKAGFNVFLHPQCHARKFVSAGTAQERVDALHDLFRSTDIDAIFAMKGGLRAMQMLEDIDYKLIRNNPKIFVGFSDITFLLSAFYKNARLVTYHGLTLSRYLPDLIGDGQKQTLDFLVDGLMSSEWNKMDVLQLGMAEGTLLGGNFSLIYTLMGLGSHHRPDFRGKILLLEDIDEEIRQIDRMLLTLKISGVFEEMAGLVIGHMTEIHDGGTTYKFNCSVRDLVLEHTQGCGKPVVMNAPFGHAQPNLPFPIGIRARLTAPEKGQAQLQLLESPFADA